MRHMHLVHSSTETKAAAGTASEHPPAANPAATNLVGSGADAGWTVGLVVLIEYRTGTAWRGALRLPFARFFMRRPPGLTFCRFMGSGIDGRFHPWPSLVHQGMFLAFDSDEAADRFRATSPLLAAIRRDARNLLSMKLAAYASRGRWGGAEPFRVRTTRPSAGPIASLTRASIRPQRAVAFWRHAPPSQAALATVPGCLIAAGLGEAPLLRQATFTLWASEASMEHYARSGAHLDAIRAARSGRHFSEDMFTRFVPYAIQGSWAGVDLSTLGERSGSRADE